MLRKPKLLWIIAAVWALTIFLTSCTFIERQVFINFVERFIPVGVPQHLWVRFWGVFGLVIVKAYHVTEYALLSFLLFLALRVRLVKAPTQAFCCAALLAALYAASDEWHQTFVPGRGGTWVDVVIDCCGIALAGGFIAWQIRRQERVQQMNRVDPSPKNK